MVRISCFIPEDLQQPVKKGSVQQLCSLLSNDGVRRWAWELSEVPQISEVGQSDIQGKKNIAEEENNQNEHNLLCLIDGFYLYS